jgi:NAD(P)-dependent dehydrogenase (short-subunit alcohol dehydrogenase family)
MTSLAGKTVVITGGTGGIGLETALAIAPLEPRLVLIGRDRARAAEAVERIRRRSPRASVDIVHADLSRRTEVRRLAAALDKAHERIDVLVNNAGAMFDRREVTEDGLERTFALNHMGYFLLTTALWDKLVKSAPARIVNVASEAHRSAQLDLADLQTKKGYSGWQAYRRSKLCNILFTRELARRLAGSGVTANCIHPGFCATGFGDNTSPLYRGGIWLLKRFFAIAPEEGARTLTYAVTAPELAGVSGEYLSNSKPATPAPAATDDVAAGRLWEESVRLARADAAG